MLNFLTLKSKTSHLFSGGSIIASAYCVSNAGGEACLGVDGLT